MTQISLKMMVSVCWLDWILCHTYIGTEVQIKADIDTDIDIEKEIYRYRMLYTYVYV